MSDLFSGIKHIGPTYPVKPVQPAVKDREPDQRKKEPPRKPRKRSDEDDDTKPIIDELV